MFTYTDVYIESHRITQNKNVKHIAHPKQQITVSNKILFNDLYFPKNRRSYNMNFMFMTMVLLILFIYFNNIYCLASLAGIIYVCFIWVEFIAQVDGSSWHGGARVAAKPGSDKWILQFFKEVPAGSLTRALTNESVSPPAVRVARSLVR